VPEAYLLQADGGFHALARRFPGNNIIVLDSDLVRRAAAGCRSTN